MSKVAIGSIVRTSVSAQLDDSRIIMKRRQSSMENVGSPVLMSVFVFLDDKSEWTSLFLVSRHWRYVASSYRRGLRSLPHMVCDISFLQFDMILCMSSRLQVIDLHSTYNLITDAVLMDIAQRCREVKYLRLGFSPHGSSGMHSWPLLPPIPTEAHQMREVSSEAIEHLWASLPSLRSVSLAACPNISDTSMNYLARNCKLLEQLFLWDCEISDRGLHELADSCESIRIINLTGCGTLNDDSLISLFKRYPQINFLRLTHTDNLSEDTFKFNKPVEDENRPLNDLEIDNVPHLSTMGLNYILEKGQNLKALRLKDCSSISDSGLIKLVRSCPRLHHLSLEEL